MDVAALLYLNPHLVADLGLTSVQAAQAAIPGLDMSQLSVQLPSVPPGFDSRVFVAAQPDVSAMNDTIRRAMKAMGLSDLAMEKRGVFVATIMEDVVLTPGEEGAPATLALHPISTFVVTSNVVRPGDAIRLIRKSIGDELTGRVLSVAADGRALVAELSGPRRAIVSGADYTLVGIRIHDCERQAAVSYARMLRSITTVPVEDIGPSADFSLGTYHSVYPETRPLGLQDSYLDYRARWKRDNEYRVIRGRDIFNLAAPYTSNLLPGVPGEAGTDFQVLGKITAGTASLGSGFLAVGPSNAWFGSNDGRGAVAAVEGGCNASVRLVGSNLVVGAMSVAALGSNLVVSPEVVSAVSGTLVVDRSSMTVGDGTLGLNYGGNINGACRVSLGRGALVVGSSNGGGGWMSTSIGYGAVSVVRASSSNEPTTTIRGSVSATDRMGIGMHCWGTESAECDSTGTAATTRLAVDGDVYLTGCVVSLSDERAKTAVRPLDRALERVAMMSGYTFEKAGDGGRRHTGLLAQEVSRALPEAVYDVPGPEGLSSVAYGNVVGLLVQAVNELRAEVRQLRGVT